MRWKKKSYKLKESSNDFALNCDHFLFFFLKWRGWDMKVVGSRKTNEKLEYQVYDEKTRKKRWLEGRDVDVELISSYKMSRKQHQSHFDERKQRPLCDTTRDVPSPSIASAVPNLYSSNFQAKLETFCSGLVSKMEQEMSGEKSREPKKWNASLESFFVNEKKGFPEFRFKVRSIVKASVGDVLAMTDKGSANYLGTICGIKFQENRSLIVVSVSRLVCNPFCFYFFVQYISLVLFLLQILVKIGSSK